MAAKAIWTILFATVDYLMLDLDQKQKAPMLFGRNRESLLAFLTAIMAVHRKRPRP